MIRPTILVTVLAAPGGGGGPVERSTYQADVTGARPRHVRRPAGASAAAAPVLV